MTPEIDKIMQRIALMQTLARQRADRVKHHEMSAKAAKAANLRDQVELRAMLEDLARGACTTGEIALQSIPHSVDTPTSTPIRVPNALHPMPGLPRKPGTLIVKDSGIQNALQQLESSGNFMTREQFDRELAKHYSSLEGMKGAKEKMTKRGLIERGIRLTDKGIRLLHQAHKRRTRP